MTTREFTFTAWDEAEDSAAGATPRHHGPPLLMGDIVARRGGVPELLIQWRRAQGEDDPAPQ